MHTRIGGDPYRTCWLAIALLMLAAKPAAATDGAGSNASITLHAAPDRVSRRLHRSGSNTTHDTHYLFGTSAIALEGGRGYYQMHDVLLHSASFSPVQGFAIGGGVQVASLVSSLASKDREPLVFARMTASKPLGGNVHLGGFALGARTSVSSSNSEQGTWPVSLGLGGAQLTFGSERAHATVSFGGAVDEHGMRDGPLVGIAGLLHMTDRFCIITEHWQLPFGSDGYRLHAYGARFTHRTMAFDAAFAVNRELAEFFVLGVPVIGLSLKL